MMHPYRALILVIFICIYVFLYTYPPLKASGLRAAGINDVLWVLSDVAGLGLIICQYQMDTLEKIEEIKAKLEKDKQ